METKDKSRAKAGQAPRKPVQRPAQGSGSAPQAPRPQGQAAPQQRRAPQQPQEYKRTAPQGASVYGASGSGSRPRTVKKVEPKPQKETVLQLLSRKGAAAAQSANASRERVKKAQKQMVAKHRKKRARRHDTPAVIYTDPVPFNRSRLAVQLVAIAAVVIAVVLGLSVFFKVEHINVSGAKVYSNWAVAEASGISQSTENKTGDSLLTFSRTRASAQIRAKLPYVEEVRIGIKLPDTVNIYIKELEVTYAIKDQGGVWWLMTSTGRIVEQSNATEAEKYTQILGVALESPVVNEQAVAQEAPPQETQEEGETLPVVVTGAQRLSAALQILAALEANDIVGEAASVDVASVNSIELWYGTQYQVQLGDTSRMEYKIACMSDVILELEDYQRGILDVSFTTWADQVGYTPFS